MIYENGQVIAGEVLWPTQPDGTPWTEDAAAAFIDATLAAHTAAEVTPPPRPLLVVTAIESDAEHADQVLISDLAEVTCPSGTVLTVRAELRDPVGKPLPLSDSFRMPLKARDGREKVLLARMNDGLITITAPLRESGAWQVTEAMINEALPADHQMAFAGVQIFVVEA